MLWCSSPFFWFGGDRRKYLFGLTDLIRKGMVESIDGSCWVLLLVVQNDLFRTSCSSSFQESNNGTGITQSGFGILVLALITERSHLNCLQMCVLCCKYPTPLPWFSCLSHHTSVSVTLTILPIRAWPIILKSHWHRKCVLRYYPRK